MRILLTLEYDGTDYAGWQRQLNGPSVQEALEDALRRATGTDTRITGASRTDAGVHALGQRAHFDTASSIPPDGYPLVLGTLLPRDIAVTQSVAVPDSVHARFSAKGKEYTYRILNRRSPSALRRRFTAHVPVPLCFEAMMQALPMLEGTHDFAAFVAAGGSQKTTVRRIDRINLVRQEDEIILTVAGNAFLYNMVRIIAGTLIDIGKGRLDAGCVARAIETGDRLQLGATAPACGLELTRVFYEGGL